METTEKIDYIAEYHKKENQKKKKKRIIAISIILIIFSFFIIIYALEVPVKDKCSTENLPDKFIVENKNNNEVKFQYGKDCAGYSASYVLRHLGENSEGALEFKSMPKMFGIVTARCMCKDFKQKGYKAKAYHGDINTLKAELLKGNPVICLVKIIINNEQGLHYLVVTGYDEQYIYMADSTGLKTNITDTKQYNRRLTYSDFEELWKTNIYPVNNVYIVVE